MCRGIDEGGRRCRGGHGPVRDVKDRARRALKKANGGVLTATPVFVPPVFSTAPVDEIGYGGEDYDLDGELIVADEVAAPEVAAPRVSSYVGTVAEIHSLLRGHGPGAFGALTIVAAYRRGDDGELHKHQHADLNRVQHITGTQKTSYDIGDGAGEFVVGRPENWDFSDGLGTFTSANVSFEYRFSGPTPAPRTSSVTPAQVRTQIAGAIIGATTAIDEATEGLKKLTPAAALENHREAGAHITERKRVLDAGACNALGITAAEWHVMLDRENPELLEAEVLLTEAYGAKFSSGLAYAKKRLAEFEATRRNPAGIQDHLDDLRAALRGVQATERILHDRRSRAQEVGV